MLDRTQDSSAQLDTGLRFGLSDDAFKRWWAMALTTIDADEYVHLYGGDMDGARMVCVLDHLTHSELAPKEQGLIERAYVIAKDLPERYLHEIKTKTDAFYLYNLDSTRMLMECVRRNAKRFIEDEITLRSTRKIKELYDRAEEECGEDRLKTERVALDGSMQWLSLQERARAADAQRRDKRAAAQAIATGKQQLKIAQAVPTIDEAKQFIVMLKEAYGEEAFVKLVEHTALLPPEDATLT